MTRTIDSNGVITETRALVPRSAGEVDTNEVKALATSYMANKAQGEKAVGLFPADLTPLQATQIARLSLAYGLDPFAGELTVFQGRPWVTLDGRIRQAQKHPAFDGIEDVRPATDAERTAFRCRDDEDLWVATVWRKDRQFPFKAFGRAGGKYEKNFIVRNEDRGPELAQKRALSRALRMAFSLPLPGETDDAPVSSAADRRSLIIEHEAPSTIRPDQVTTIHTLKGKLGLNDDAYRAWLAGVGVDSSTQLTEGDAQAVIDMLNIELAERDADAVTADDAQRTAEAEARGDAVRARTGKRARDLVTLPDDDPPPSPAPGASSAPPSDVAADDDSADIAAEAAAEMGGVVVEHAVEPASDGMKGVIARLLGDVGIDWQTFAAEKHPFLVPTDFNDMSVEDYQRAKEALEKKKR